MAWMLIIVLWGQKTFDHQQVVKVGPIATIESCDSQAKWLLKRSDITDAFCVQYDPTSR